MSLKDIWSDKVDGIDIVLADDINSIAHAVIDLEEIDTEMSDTSTNAVQNKVVKNYIDESIGDIETALDSKAENTDIDTLKSKSIPHTTASGYPLTVTDHLNAEQVIDYKVYGNSVQDGTPSPDNPIEIQSVGDLITDETSEYYGKYDIPITVRGKNLFDISKSTGFIDTGGGLTNVISDGIIVLTSSRTSASASLTLGTFEPGNYYIKMESDDYSGASPIFVNGRNSQLKAIGGNVVKIKEEAIVEIIVFPNQNVTYHFKNIQITKSDVPTDYEPYSGETKHIYLNEPLRKVGASADYIDYRNQKVIRQVEVLDDTGAKTIDESLGLLDTPTEEIITIPELTTPISSVANVSIHTTIKPSNMELIYYQDINKVITNLTNAIISQGGNI